MIEYNLPSIWDTSTIPLLIIGVGIILIIVGVAATFIRDLQYILIFALVGVIVGLGGLTATTITYDDGTKNAIISQTRTYLNDKYDVQISNQEVGFLTNIYPVILTANQLHPNQFDKKSSQYLEAAIYPAVDSIIEGEVGQLQLIKVGDDLQLIQIMPQKQEEVALRNE